MYDKNNLKERCDRILEDNGGKVADRARTILLKDPALKNLRPPLEFISENWRDLLTPALMRLSCEAVGGRPEQIYEAALAMSLMNLSAYLWDDIIDKAPLKLFKPTLFGKFGEDTTLIIGGLASAKAFSILNQMDVSRVKLQNAAKLFWNLWTKVAKAEAITLRLPNLEKLSPGNKLWKIKTEASNTEACLRIGALIGNGTESEIQHLGRYGLCLGIILELWKDFHVSVNLTLELAEKIRKGTLPYSILWAGKRSEKIRRKLEDLSGKNTIEQAHIKEIVGDALETKAFENTVKTIRRFTKKGREELFELKRNKATRTLQLFIEAQPQLFIGNLSTLLAQGS